MIKYLEDAYIYETEPQSENAALRVQLYCARALLELESRDKLEAFMRSHESKLDLPEIPKGLTQTMYEFYVTDYGCFTHRGARNCKTVMIKAYLKKYDPEVQLAKSQTFICHRTNDVSENN